MRLTKTLSAAGSEQILAALDRSGPRPFSALARDVEDKNTANRALKRLVEAGLVERRVLQDRLRSVEYQLTARGREVAEVARRLREIEKALSGKDRPAVRPGR
jgi:DNA-binding HxlR family transcriptional regulator